MAPRKMNVQRAIEEFYEKKKKNSLIGTTTKINIKYFERKKQNSLKDSLF